MVNPINNDDAALMLSKFGTKYLAEGEHTDVSASQFVAQAATTLTVLTGGDAAISDNNKDYLASMSLGSVELKAGALIVAPNGELFKSITVATGGALVAYNSVIEGVKPGSFVGLLDTYPDAAAAYSLRKLRTDYSGSTIRVRRTDNTEQDIGFVDNELDTVSLLSFVGSGDGFVVTWYDQSGEGNDSTQNTVLLQPQIVSSGVVNLENGKPAVFCDDNSLELDSVPYSDFSSNTIVSVAKSDSTTQGNLYNFSNSNRIHGHTYNRSANNSYAAMTINSGGTYKIGGGLNGQSLVTTTHESPTETFVNSVEVTDSNLTSGNFSSNFILSRDSAFKMVGNMQELILFNGNQSTNQLAIETNINNFYSIY